MYLAGFSVAKYIKSKSTKALPIKVISVGNISSGGVGKSLVSQYLIENFFGGSIILRGYRGKNEKTGDSFVVSDGAKVNCDVGFSGDEAYMFSKMLNVPIVVGKDRYKSAIKLLGLKQPIDYVVLDDAYQNFRLKKDLEILLLDARNPFGNGHCFPAGMLREKDLTRADLIILTHASSVSFEKIEEIKSTLPDIPVFCGEHKFKGVLDLHQNKVNLSEKKLLAFAGVGSFKGFLDSLNRVGILVEDFIEYRDHHKYTSKNITDIKNRSKNLDGVITTRKDLYKVLPISEGLNLYCLDVGFEFLSEKEKLDFFKIVHGVLSK